MRKVWIVSALSVCAMFFCGCAGAKAPSREDLMHRRFVLSEVDGKAFSGAERVPDIAFDENFRVYGAVCNRYMGQGELAGDVLTVRQAASTKMLCGDDELNNLETLFHQMLQAGAKIDLSDASLTLRQGGRALTYTLRDWIR